MAEVEAMKVKTVHALLNDVEDFVRSNRHSPEVELRWLSAYLDSGLAPLLRGARSDNFDDGSKDQIARFRLGEIADAKAKYEREIADLEREAAKINVA